MCDSVVALEKMDGMLSSDSRWHCQYENISDIDESKVSECGEIFMTLMMTVTGIVMFISSYC